MGTFYQILALVGAGLLVWYLSYGKRSTSGVQWRKHS